METMGKERWHVEGKKNMELRRGEGGLGGQKWRNRPGCQYKMCNLARRRR
jgi:hypothetical protein